MRIIQVIMVDIDKWAENSVFYSEHKDNKQKMALCGCINYASSL